MHAMTDGTISVKGILGARTIQIARVHRSALGPFHIPKSPYHKFSQILGPTHAEIRGCHETNTIWGAGGQAKFVPKVRSVE